MMAVVRRELKMMRRRPLYPLASAGTLAFCMVFFLTFFRNGMPHGLPVGVVDLDGSSLSRELRRQIDATDAVSVCEFGNYEQARKAMQCGRINAFCVIPENFARKMQSGRQPVLTMYTKAQYCVGGSLAYKDLITMANLASGAAQREILSAKGMNETSMAGMIQPIAIDTHQIGNPTADYGVYLANILIPGIMEMIVILITVYAIGSELKYGTSRQLLKTAGNSTVRALAGKMLPYTLLFTLMGLACDIVLYGIAGYPLAGNILNMMAGITLLVLSSEAVGIFLIGTLPVLRLCISISALYSVLAFSMAGFTFPVEAMTPYVRGLSAIFPLRHYYEMYVQEAVFGAGFTAWWPEAVHLLIFLFLPFTVLKRLGKAFRKLNYPKN